MNKQAATLAMVALAALAGCGGGGTNVDSNPAAQTTPGTLKLGLLVSRTGSSASLGQNVEYAARLAVKEINEAGGVNGQQLELILRDDKLDADAGVLSARELAALAPVAIFGPFSSRVAIPVAQQVTIAAGIPFIASGSSPLITALDDKGTVFRTVASDSLQGAALADHILDQGLTRVALIHVDDAFGVGASEAVRQRLAARGYPPLANITYSATKTVGFDGELAALTANGVPQAVVMVGFALDGASIARGLKDKLGSQMPRLFGSGNFGAAFISNAGDAALGMQWVSPTAPRSTPSYAAYRDAFVRNVGLEPEGTSFTGYDAVYLLALAMAQGGANTRAAILANLQAVSRPDSAAPVVIGPGQFAQALAAAKAGRDIDYQGVAGSIDFDANGDPTSGTYLISEVARGADGTMAFVERKVFTFEPGAGK
ncbi:ABC transporter substrate-binding protein [Pseudoduganella ginsengisoli]|uniref:ABC transporter substrate-binding protein n=1 Tax=Pseudoduganella ginsengisoli TaxID=1462440 RepID=A0A6L6Q3C8_9BURK|nr:ABC transporter substrate-binding protein [Pseudoduganella ginsengisoli]MTW03939.1 ABC transporter substrate-binding protein [Pseudoduganella ginsengisoli]